ncbi:DNA phosphorothioation-dependent restriction protein DptF [Alkalibacillus aidingensis]|uniref:DNA phosphorothioation-dependent restriction protein DptF n=1 Tax=Alkalibacillus aidingensis TaxID=2747607 RepID=UPI002948BE1D|nr:DNA phosphorothioation-dependent restriction protein DptF [Alkalibacillus aidingensis]
MSRFIEFLQRINTTAAQYALDMERIIFHNPSSANVEARKFAEVILSEIFKKEKLDLPYKSSFYEKISYLIKEDYLEEPWIQKSFDSIRISGNKSAHPSEYNELAEAYKLHKEMYNIAVWFYEVYIIEDLTIPPYESPQPPKYENIEELVQQKLQELIGKAEFNNFINKQDVKETEEDMDGNDSYENNLKRHNSSLLSSSKGVIAEKPTILEKNLDHGDSYLLREIRRLKDSSQEAIENANQFSNFKDYLHVDRKIQLDLESILSENARNQSNLILLCGNVGDGKSHILAYLKEKKPDLIEEYTIFNDATESFSPNKDAMETLTEILSDFSDQSLGKSNKKVILAINMGVLHNFITTDHKRYTYNYLKEFVEQSQLFTPSITTHYRSGNFDLLSFGDYHPYELTENGPISNFYSSLLQKVTNPSNDNPFYMALMEDEKNEVHTMVHENFKLLQNDVVQETVVQLVIQGIVKKKLVISARAFLNFIADIVIPDQVSNYNLMSEFNVLEDSLPNLLFNRVDRSEILRALSDLDPLHYRSVHIDQLVIDLNTLSDWETVVNGNIDDRIPINWLKPFLTKDNLMGYSFNLFFESFIRITYLTNKKFESNVSEQGYIDFMKYLYYFNKGDKQNIKKFYEELKTAIFTWKGSPRKDYIYLNKPSEKYRIAQRVTLRPSIDHLKPMEGEVLESFKSIIHVSYRDGDGLNKVQLEIDYPLYNLLSKVLEGYRPNKQDEEDAIKFVEFIDKLMGLGNKREELLVFFKADQRFYTLKKDDFGAFVFERE